MIVQHATRATTLSRNGSQCSPDALAIALTCGFGFLSSDCVPSARENLTCETTIA